VKYPGEISPITFIQSTRHASPIKPKESLMKPSRSSQGEEKLASLSDSVTDMASVCNGTSHISSRPGPAVSKDQVAMRCERYHCIRTPYQLQNH
jgi:hypothetical protein